MSEFLSFLLVFLVISAIKHGLDRKYDTATIRAERDAAWAENARLSALIMKYQFIYKANTAADLKKYQPTGVWQTLGIQPTRDKAVVMKAFRKKAQTAHPDKGGSAKAFQALFEARNAALREIGA